MDAANRVADAILSQPEKSLGRTARGSTRRASVPYNFPMQFLTLSRRRTDAFPPEAFTAELLARESQRVRELYAAGILRQIWKRADIPGASILWEAVSEEEVRAAIASLPIAQAGMLETVAFVPLQPYPGFCPAV